MEFCDVGRVKVHGELAIAIVFNDVRAVADLRHSRPDFPHGIENTGSFVCRHGRGSSDGAQLRDGFAAAFDHDNATFRSFAHQFRSMNVEFTD